ncbi:DNA-binding response regulator, OmpR family, contains REC and winged-helix (wHTH) domain [Amycolatopsis saalfeldensis]|uniref:DNA-binding response regulator, OmpR family, contains REC and winged-helix (WHTH) domain n=1 Tax=Amycolatopsis saalfeldensis TaxID=394193 RepID=A0A1H8YDH2_9PSEU|nr:DNA-binding response regulator, OmpR family, contains REC and winged-helix (wHTH) domain [Amycolatopsis saalfeldensis]
MDHGVVRVLVIEDETRLADALAWGLRADGYAVDVTGNGAVGLEQAMTQPYDAVILDIMLPGLNGYRVCAELRRSGVDTPILMLTAKNGEHDEAEALDTGADDYLSKPFAWVVLTARLRALLRRAPSTRSPKIEVGELVIDPARRACHRAGQEIRLTAKEFTVLECLARQAGYVVSKTEILDRVWDGAYQGDSNVIEVYVSALRRKIDVPFGCRTIDTVRGVGYRLLADA